MRGAGRDRGLPHPAIFLSMHLMTCSHPAPTNQHEHSTISIHHESIISSVLPFSCINPDVLNLARAVLVS